jgi:protein TonB
MLQATIGIDGIPKDIVAVTKLGFGFEEAAIAALKKWKFIPAKKKGKDVERRINIPIEFKLED